MGRGFRDEGKSSGGLGPTLWFISRPGLPWSQKAWSKCVYRSFQANLGLSFQVKVHLLHFLRFLSSLPPPIPYFILFIMFNIYEGPLVSWSLRSSLENTESSHLTLSIGSWKLWLSVEECVTKPMLFTID